MPYALHPPGTRRNNPFYIVRGSIGGLRFEASCATTDRGKAESFAIDYVAQLKLETGLTKPKTFREAADAYCALKNPRKDDRVAIGRLVAHMGKRELSEIGGADLVAAANALLPHGSNAHKNRSVITPGSAILHYAADQRWCPYQRHRRFKVSSRSSRAPASVGSVMAILGAVDGYKRLLVAWLYETGQRITDSVKLRDEHLDLAAGRALILSSKTDDATWIDLSPELCMMLNASQRIGGKVFPWSSRTSVYKWLRPLVRELGVTYTPHMSRHALATDLRAMGLDTQAIAQRGGWRDVKSAGRYVHHQSTGTNGRTVGAVLQKTTVGQR